MKLHFRDYIWYKLLNSLFLGVSVGSIFVLYTPLQPSIYSLGGIFLALGMLFIAKMYDKIMNLKAFFYITMFVELTVLFFILFFLIFNYSYTTALLVYTGYQLTFMFGNYLVRMETIAVRKTAIFSFLDIAKQKGYLAGMIISYGFYKILEYMNISDKQTQVYNLHVGLFLLQMVILICIYRAFRYNNSR